MLPARQRVRRPAEFEVAVRRGRRAGRRLLVAHAGVSGDPGAPARLGVVVSRAVGGSVVRNRVKRRLRHVGATRLPRVADGTLLVLRANPAAAQASSADLARDLDSALQRLGLLTAGDARMAAGDARMAAGDRIEPGDGS